MTTIQRCGSIAIIGRPNVGKSTLLNRLLGQKLVITSHKAQTTRHAILGIKTRPEGQLLFVDTPGMHRRGQSALNRYLNRAARVALADVDVALCVVEALRFTAEDALVMQALADHATPALVAVNKIDQVTDKTALLPYLAELATRYPFRAIWPISAKTGAQLDGLELALLEALPVGEKLFPDDQLTDRSERFLATELLREQLVQRYGAELPYHTTVTIEHFIDRAGHYQIDALIWVERDSQKAIIIGHHGAALKRAATQARLEMQKVFDCSVRLQVWVRVKKGWSSDVVTLTQLGYGAL